MPHPDLQGRDMDSQDPKPNPDELPAAFRQAATDANYLAHTEWRIMRSDLRCHARAVGEIAVQVSMPAIAAMRLAFLFISGLEPQEKHQLVLVHILVDQLLEHARRLCQ